MWMMPALIFRPYANWILVLALLSGTSCRSISKEKQGRTTNSIGMTLVRIEPGSFEMGVDSVPLPEELTKGFRNISWGRPTRDGDFDEVPVHEVTITRPIRISRTEVTIEQFRQFKPDYQGSKYWAPYAAGISWEDATAFCEWLSRREGKPYRLPTEAEWEYVCRAGTRTPFSAGAEPDKAGVANPWGVENMQASVPEWCLDWYGPYPSRAQTDPVGPDSGIGRVVRGGGMDYRPRRQYDGGRRIPAELAYYRRSANRASVMPDFGSAHGHIGFRVVRAEMPTAKPYPAEERFFQTAVKQQTPDLTHGPDFSKPFYRTREMFPNIGTNRTMREVGWKIGLARGLGQAWHNVAFELCDNGDLVAAYYNTERYEDDADQSLVTMRLRRGSEEWDMPEPWPDMADAADTAPLFWNDGGKLWLFWGLRSLVGGPPFQYMTSSDNGATWGAVTTPKLEGRVGDYTPQPVNSVVRDRNGTVYIPIDGKGNDTALFATSDGGKTWRDTGGRTAGRHTTFVMARDGSIMGFGGKNTAIEGKMPLSVTRDGGKSYEVTKTEFMPLGGGQRPSVLRLKSGRLFFVADTLSSRVPGGRKASYVALSDDDGRTWTRRILPINSTVGYVKAIQVPDGMIHIVTSKTKPAFLHIELNEAWVLEGGAPTPLATETKEVSKEMEKYPDSKLKAEWSGGVAADGTYRLDGLQVFYYENGAKRWESEYKAGKRIGTETYWNPDGSKKWQRIFGKDGGWTWRIFDNTGRVVAESKWRGKTLIDPGGFKAGE